MLFDAEEHTYTVAELLNSSQDNWNKFDIAEKFNIQFETNSIMFISFSFAITMTFLGALNTVGRYIVNMTRGGQEASITNNNPSENVPDAILTLTKNVLGQNVTKTIEPMIKRIGVVETRDDPTIEPVSDKLLLNATSATLDMVDPKKKKVKKQKTKRKEQPAEQPVEQQHQQQQVELFSAESRKISIFW